MSRSAFRGLHCALLLSAALTTIGAAARPALADPSSGADPANDGIETVTVTAEKRAADIQSVPFSINAFSGEQLEQRRVDNFNDLSKVAPGITFNGDQYRGTSSLSIRGASLTSESGAVDSGVETYIDDVPTIGNAEIRNEFFDLNRVEVLRGPQGTLFGRNVTGGLVSFHSNEPSFTPQLQALVGYGNYNSYLAQGFITGPLLDDVAARLAVSFDGHEGYGVNAITGKRQGTDDEQAARGQVLYQPDNRFKLLVGAAFDHERGDTYTLQFFGNTAPPAFVSALMPSYAGLSFTNPNIYNNAWRGRGGTDAFSMFMHGDYAFDFGTLTSITGFRLNNIEDIDADKLGLPDQVLLFDGALNESVVEHSRQFSEELRLASQSDQPLRWIGGLFFLSSERDRFRQVYTGVANLPGTGLVPLGLGPYDYYTRGPAAGGAGESGLNAYDAAPSTVDYTNDSTLNSYAVFGQADYDFYHDFTLTIGGRYSWENRDGYNVLPSLFSVAGLPVTSPFNGHFEAFTPKATLTYKPRDEDMFYATVSRGFKSGGFDDFAFVPAKGAVPIACQTVFGAATAVPAGGCPGAVVPSGLGPLPVSGSALTYYSAYMTPPFAPETAWNYEVGAKTSWFDDHLIANISVFREDYKNYQSKVFNFASGVYQNVTFPFVRVQGFEAEAVGKPLDWLTVGGTWTYQNSEGRFPISFAPDTCTPTITIACSRAPLDIPKNAVNLYTDVVVPLDLPGAISVGGDITFRSEVQQNVPTAASPSGTTPPFILAHTATRGLINVHGTWTSDDGGWQLQFWGKNITDRRYLITAVPTDSYFGVIPGVTTGPGTTLESVTWNTPATYGATLTYHWQ